MQVDRDTENARLVDHNDVYLKKVEDKWAGKSSRARRRSTALAKKRATKAAAKAKGSAEAEAAVPTT